MKLKRTFTNHNSHGQHQLALDPTRPRTVAVDDRPRRGYSVQIHGGMVSKSPHDGSLHVNPSSHENDSNPQSPLKAGPPLGKRLTPVQPHPGMRSRTSDAHLGDNLAQESKAMLGLAHMDSCDRFAFQNTGRIPDQTEEN